MTAIIVGAIIVVAVAAVALGLFLGQDPRRSRADRSRVVKDVSADEPR